MLNLKKKIITGVMSVCLVSSVGVAFAGTNAGEQLGNWYNAKINTAATTVNNVVNPYRVTKISQYNGSASTYLTGSIAEIETSKITSIDTSNDAIGSFTRASLAALNTKLDELKIDLDAQTDAYIANKNSTATAEIGAAFATNLSTGDAAIALKNTDSLAEVTTNVNNTTTRATNALNNRIAAIKTELETLIEQRKSEAQTAILDHIDSQIAAKTMQLNAAIDQYKLASQTAISTLATDLTDTALADLDAILDSIDN